MIASIEPISPAEFDPGTTSPVTYDFDGPSLYETDPEAAQPGASASEGKPKAKRAAKKSAKKASAKAKKAPKEPKAPKAPRTKKAPALGPRGIRKDGAPRQRPGTNTPRSEASAKLGAKIAKLRLAKGLSQKALADKCGLAQPTIANIERGVANAGPGTFPQIAKALGMSLDDAVKNPRKSRESKGAKVAKPAKAKIVKVAKTPKKSGKVKAKRSAKKGAKKSRK